MEDRLKLFEEYVASDPEDAKLARLWLLYSPISVVHFVDAWPEPMNIYDTGDGLFEYLKEAYWKFLDDQAPENRDWESGFDDFELRLMELSEILGDLSASVNDIQSQLQSVEKLVKQLSEDYFSQLHGSNGDEE